MISVEEALDFVERHTFHTEASKVKLKATLGLILAQDLRSPINMPPFDQSAMDGYAVNYDPAFESFSLVGETQAGSNEQKNLVPGEAIRIFTGAPVPESANMVIKQEDVTVLDNKISFKPESEGANIRPCGEQVKINDLIMKKGKKITPAAIGYLATLGFTEISVYDRPRITILTTGNELVKPGSKLEFGQIYESNSIMLETAFMHYGFHDIKHVSVPDNYEQTVEAIKSVIEDSEIIILSGGISVGDYDFVNRALNELDVEQIFYKVKQKPGKPLYFGKLKDKLFFALPGNPAAALTNFYLYILPALNHMIGGDFKGLERTELPLKRAHKKKGVRTEILKANAKEKEVEILGAQSSAMLSSFSDANALVVIPDDINQVEAGEFVLTFLL